MGVGKEGKFHVVSLENTINNDQGAACNMIHQSSLGKGCILVVGENISKR